jgi:riboflavin kinase / FMN adenylyltransferase
MSETVFINNAERLSNTVLTVGTFDGVHAGHRVLINKVVDVAKTNNARSVIVTFDPHPREIINPGAAGIKLLSSLDERRELLADIGVDVMVVIPFDRDFSLLSSEEFVKNIIWKKVGVSHFIIGYDHHFGRNREGTIDTVNRLGKELGFDCFVVSKQEVGDKTVSSTAVRKAIMEQGDMELAASFLERYYILNGKVIHGDKRGKEIGYPTANIQPDNPAKAIPKQGVYAVWVRSDQKFYPGMMNIGKRPTFEGSTEVMEVHIFGFNNDIYGRDIHVQFVKRLRDEKAFSSVGDLIEQLKKDEHKARIVLKKQSPNIAKLRK